jgi:hypothetical protein
MIEYSLSERMVTDEGFYTDVNDTRNEYLQLLEKQKGKCAICNETLPVSQKRKKSSRSGDLDHDHSTGGIRGLLCSKDNRLIGWGNDRDPYRLLSSTMYTIRNALKYGYESELKPQRDRKEWQKIYMGLYTIKKSLES